MNKDIKDKIIISHYEKDIEYLNEKLKGLKGKEKEKALKRKEYNEQRLKELREQK